MGGAGGGGVRISRHPSNPEFKLCCDNPWGTGNRAIGLISLSLYLIAQLRLNVEFVYTALPETDPCYCQSYKTYPGEHQV